MKIRKTFLILLGLYLISAILGFLLVVFKPSVGYDLLLTLKRSLPRPKSGLETFVLIFVHNSQISLLNYLSALLFGVGSYVIVGLNGFILGIVLGYLLLGGYSLPTLLLAILPHGVFEIPAFVLSGTAGICLYRSLRWKECDVKLSIELLLLSIALLFLAAFIETYVTPQLIGR